MTEKPFYACCLAAPASGGGKTTVTLALMRALRGRGLQVQGFKCGPDYIDPSFHALATGRPSWNLDTWMMGRDGVREVWQHIVAAEQPDVALCEGVMGLFDGRGGRAAVGSTADCARCLGLPVVLVTPVRGMAASLAALVRGFVAEAARFGQIRLVGVIANGVGSPRHRAMLEEALARGDLPPLLGALPREADWALPERQLGLVPAGEMANQADWLRHLDRAGAYLDLERLLPLIRRPCSQMDTRAVLAASTAAVTAASSVPERSSAAVTAPIVAAAPCAAAPCLSGSVAPVSSEPVPPASVSSVPRSSGPALSEHSPAPRGRLAVAKDEAFWFSYPANERLAVAQGWELVPFSPLHDAALPPDISGLWIGGGYPEEYGAALAANTAMHDAVRAFAAAGGEIYAECGGFMYLCRALEDAKGAVHPLCGLLPGVARMGGRARALGYREVLVSELPFGLRLPDQPGPCRVRGHEFHWSNIDMDTALPSLYLADSQSENEDGGSAAPLPLGVVSGTIRAGYVHLYWGGSGVRESRTPPLHDALLPSSREALMPSSPDVLVPPLHASCTPSVPATAGRGGVLLLDGPSSTGKSRLARVLRARLNAPVFSVDDFLRGWGVDSVRACVGETGAAHSLLAAWNAAVVAAARTGALVIGDHVLGEDPQWMAAFRAAVGDLPLWVVELRCAETELQRREASRGDRSPDWTHAARQCRIWQDVPQSLVLDTTHQTPEACADAVLRHLEAGLSTALGECTRIV